MYLIHLVLQNAFTLYNTVEHIPLPHQCFWLLGVGGGLCFLDDFQNVMETSLSQDNISGKIFMKI